MVEDARFLVFALLTIVMSLCIGRLMNHLIPPHTPNSCLKVILSAFVFSWGSVFLISLSYYSLKRIGEYNKEFQD
jgi:hypothetical protein